MLSFVFPGQGSQKKGMLEEMYQHFPTVRDTFSEASEVLGFDLWHMISHDEDKLNCTANTQPAILAASIALWRVWLLKGGKKPGFMAGHSLGEYSALVASEAIDFVDALKLVRLRGELMQKAVPQGEGAMAAVLGLDDQGVIDACAEASQGEVVTPVNFNAPGQVVIAGVKNAVTRAIDTAKAMGAKRAILLPVSVPSHCILMKSAADELAKTLQQLTIKLPVVPIVHNVDAAVHPNEAEIREALIHQLYSPVEWVKSMQRLEEENVKYIIECGPGRVLTGLNKRICENVVCISIEDEVGLDEALKVT